MSTTLEKKVDKLTRIVEKIAAYDRFMPVEKFCDKYGYTRRQVDHLRSQYPQIWDGIGGDKVSANERTVWRNIRIDLDAYNALFSSPLQSR